jgi:hypothetical protein
MTAANPNAEAVKLPMAPARGRDMHVLEEGAAMTTTIRDEAVSADAAPVSLPRRAGHFVQHFFEMCVPMCIGFALGDLLYFWLAGLAGYSEPFSELPVLSTTLVTVFMTAPMAAWMRYRRMPRGAIIEMSATMPVVAAVLLALGWIGALPMDSLALLEHGLMMPAMLVPMLARRDLYTGASQMQARHSAPTPG